MEQRSPARLLRGAESLQARLAFFVLGGCGGVEAVGGFWLALPCLPLSPLA